MIVGVGIDLLRVSRLATLFQKTSTAVKGVLPMTDKLARGRGLRLADRILAQREKEEFDRKFGGNEGKSEEIEGMVKYLANRWAVKEAAYKAGYPHLPLTWKALDLQYQRGKPELHLLPAVMLSSTSSSSTVTATPLDLSSLSWHVSISHDGDYLTAMVVLERTI